MSQSLQAFALETKSIDRILMHLSYIGLLFLVSTIPRNGLHAATQFTLARTPGEAPTKEPQIIFISNFHSLE